MERQDQRMLGPHPEEQALREEIARLRASLTAVLLQKDELVLIQCRRIEAAYLRRFGALELKVYESWCACLRAKRRAKLLRAARNRREQPEPEQIEATLDEELSDYRRELEDRFRPLRGGGGAAAVAGRGGRRMLKELSKSGSGSLIRTMHSEIQIPKPYSEDIFLLRTDVAGTTHTAGIEELESFLAPGERLELVRVPDNFNGFCCSKYTHFNVAVRANNTFFKFDSKSFQELRSNTRKNRHRTTEFISGSLPVITYNHFR